MSETLRSGGEIKEGLFHGPYNWWVEADIDDGLIDREYLGRNQGQLKPYLPSPEGVMHGPYVAGPVWRRNIAHVQNQYYPTHLAISEALSAGRIDRIQQKLLEDNLKPWKEEAQRQFEEYEVAFRGIDRRFPAGEELSMDLGLD